MTCPYCLQPKPTTSSVFTQEKDIDAEIERVEDLISRLITERSKLHEKKNGMRSPIYSLPTEIFAVIFKFACPPVDFWGQYGLDGCLDTPEVTYPHIIGVLSAVSTRWHNVVSSMPSLWASFIADSRDLRLMQTVFARSESLPVSASFSLRSASYLGQSAILNSIVLEHTARIRMLHVRGATRNWLKQHIACFIDLESLFLEDAITRKEILSVKNPCPRLVLKKIRCRISLAWSKIRVLHLIDIPADVSLEMLEKCTNLIEFRLRDPVVSRVERVQLPSSPFILPCLELFEWSVYRNSEADRAILRYARMPTLQTLIWNHLGIIDTPSDALSTFLKHLPSSLVTVQVNEGSGSWMFSHFLTLSSVKHLILRDCDISFRDDVFRKLASEMRIVENREMPVLPELQSICLDSGAEDLDQEDVLKIFRRSRPQLPGSLPESSFRLELSCHKVDWRLEIQEELRKMAEKGHKVELWECSQPVDWLPR
ncbi:hypothetical protein AGABI1DRAFT_127245 [Agaricus bisporus var. burnettii JB137-S8]|uniref:F-box domain-containing protein n=1 Tax=Agaricus bisporus var. burnettii (strain JB137-S8 / ATCC MYA-4627 / FGSC 10392) TaxID=597362 RepID=K5W357_AGABU|nr:uncharacterized protein AGABI1DRAFT_127245 [Agaricus bisporus var. burnettii JB137-S8]EKM81229.1 hypothetical protein AGABI1DRAFT_127245 [Agaricus bisporus var. burnettii JB137-S8]